MMKRKRLLCFVLMLVSSLAICFGLTACKDDSNENPDDSHVHTIERIAGYENTCTIDGLTDGQKCSVCGEILVEQKVIPAPGHKEKAVEGIAATCTQPGLSEGKRCSVCGEVLVEQTQTPPTGHTEITIEGVEPTCSSVGYTEGKKCSVCGEILVAQTEIPMIEHTPVAVAVTPATCAHTGLTAGTKCSVCGEILSGQMVIPKIPHSYGAGVVTQPTCTRGGYTTYTCYICFESYTSDATPALGHTKGEPKRENEVPATCTKAGSYDEVISCTVCNEVISRTHHDVAALTHDWSAVSYTWSENNLTCKAERTCSNCNEKQSEEVTTVYENTATCTASGVEKYTATFKNEIFETQVKNLGEVAALNHAYEFDSFVWGENYTAQAKLVCSRDQSHVTYETLEVANQVTKTASCKQAGERTYTATYGEHSDSKTEEIAQLAHTPAAPVIENNHPASCGVAGGYDEVVYCSICNEVISSEHHDVAALTHDWSAVSYTWSENNLTCKAERTCANCNEKESEEATAVYENTATCTESGVEKYTATFKNNLFATQVMTIREVAALNHSYEFDSFVWGENYTAQAKLVCSRDSSHITYETLEVANQVTKTASCKQAGERTYTATYGEHSDSKTEEIAQLAHTPAAPVIENNHPASCGVAGSYDEVVYCSICNEVISSEHHDVAALTHDWSAVSYTWPENNLTCKAERTCSNCNEKQSEEVTTVYENTATCTASGVEKYTATFKNEIFETQVKNLGEVAALNHAYEFDSFVWGENYTAQAKLICSRDPSHITYETLEVANQVTKTASCKQKGERTYTATYGEHSDSKTEEIAQLAHTPAAPVIENNQPASCGVAGSYDEVIYCSICNEVISSEHHDVAALTHDWSAVSYTWSVDNTTCTAERTCANCNEKQSEEVSAVYENTATCTTSGVEKYTATFKNEIFETQVKNLGEVAALNHSYEFDSIVWGENYTAQAKLICSRDSSHITYEEIEVANQVTKTASCKQAGERTYTATYGKNTETKTEVIAQLAHTPASAVIENNQPASCGVAGGYDEVVYCSICNEVISSEHHDVAALTHDWSAVSYTWSVDNTTCTAERTCANCNEKESEEVTAVYENTATCTASGVEKYTATFKNEIFETQVKNLGEVAALNHAYEFDSFVWGENYTAQAKLVCSRDHSHVTYEEIEVANQVTKTASCKEKGERTYTATYGEHSDSKTEEIAQLAHTPAAAVIENVQGGSCTEAGSYDEVVYCSVCGDELSRNTVEGATTSHQYEATYTWSANNTVCTANYSCKICGEGAGSENGQISVSIVTPATSSKEGTKVYAASFANPALEKQLKEASYTYKSNENVTVSPSTVAVHDPSIVVAYEKDGKTYPAYVSGSRKVYFVFGTQLSMAYSYDLINWTAFTNNLNNSATLYSMMPVPMAHANLNSGNALDNAWAPDVIWNPNLEKWTMYLTINGDYCRSSIVLLTADDLRGNWTYVAPVVFSGIGTSNNADAVADYKKVTGETSVPSYYQLYRNSVRNLLYDVNAIDAFVTFDGGKMYMTYGSWFGGIYMLELDPATGLRNYNRSYERTFDKLNLAITENNLNTTQVLSDKYLGIHLAGGNHVSGEGSYIHKVGDTYYLFITYGGLEPDGGYNMRQFQSKNIEGPYVDAQGNSALNPSSESLVWNGRVGTRAMTGYTYSWWNYSYVAEGHNSVFTDTDGTTYLVYHNKFMDGTRFHVMKVHQLIQNEKGVLVVSPFESNKTDEIAKGLTAEEIAGEYRTLYMTRNNGTYANNIASPVTEVAATFNADGTLSMTTDSAHSGTWSYDKSTGLVTISLNGDYTYYGAFLYQNLEGTSLRTLTFTAVGTQQYTVWGYKFDLKLMNKLDPAKYPIPDEVPEWVSEAGVEGKVLYVKSSEGTSLAVPAFDATNSGISLSFYLTSTNNNNDWGATAIGVNGLNVTLPNLDPWNNTAGFTTGINRWPSADLGHFYNGAAYDCFLSAKCFVTITIDENGVTYYKDGVKVVAYKATDTFDNSSVTISSFVSALLARIKANGVTLLGGVSGSDLVLTRALTEEETTALYTAYSGKPVEPLFDETIIGDVVIDNRTYQKTNLTAQEITNNDTSAEWWDGNTTSVEIPEGNFSLVYRWVNTQDPNWYQDVVYEFEGDSIFFNKNAMNDNKWADMGTLSSYVSYVNGVQTALPEQGDSVNGLYAGTYTASLIRVGTRLYIDEIFESSANNSVYRAVTVITNMPTSALQARLVGNPFSADNLKVFLGGVSYDAEKEAAIVDGADPSLDELILANVEANNVTYQKTNLAKKTITNNDTDGDWWNGNSSDLSIAAGDFSLVYRWENTRDTNYSNDVVYEFNIDTVYFDMNATLSNPWNNPEGQFPMGTFTSTFYVNGVKANAAPTVPTTGAYAGVYTASLIRSGSTLVVDEILEATSGTVYRTLTVFSGFTTDALTARVAGNPYWVDNLQAFVGGVNVVSD